MASTTILPASAMTSKHPAAGIQGFGWSQLPGSASQVAAAADGAVWVLSDSPAGPDKFIWHYSGGTWTNVGGMASQIAVAPNGTLYAINSGGGTYAYSGGSWTALGGGASAITTVADNSIFVLTNSSTGDRAIWHNVAGTWSQAPGSGTALYGSIDPGSHANGGGTISPGGLYIVNALGAIYYLNPAGGYVQLPGNASSIASTTNGGTFALAYPANPNGSTRTNTTWTLRVEFAVRIRRQISSNASSSTSERIRRDTHDGDRASRDPGERSDAVPDAVGGAKSDARATPARALRRNVSTPTLDDVDSKIDWTPMNTITQLTLRFRRAAASTAPTVTTSVFHKYEIEVFNVRALLVTRKHETGSSGDDGYHIWCRPR